MRQAIFGIGEGAESALDLAPHLTESVRVVILAQEGGQVGALEVEHKELVSAPESPTAEPQLQQRP
jgi:hypothetical protein